MFAVSRHLHISKWLGWVKRNHSACYRKTTERLLVVWQFDKIAPVIEVLPNALWNIQCSEFLTTSQQKSTPNIWRWIIISKIIWIKPYNKRTENFSQQFPKIVNGSDLLFILRQCSTAFTFMRGSVNTPSSSYITAKSVDRFTYVARLWMRFLGRSPESQETIKVCKGFDDFPLESFLYG